MLRAILIALMIIGPAGTCAAEQLIQHGSTDQTAYIRIVDADGAPVTTVVAATAGLDLEYVRTRSAPANIAASISDLAATNSAHTDGGIKHVGDGWYRVDVEDAAFASGVPTVLITGRATGLHVLGEKIQLTGVNAQDAIRFGMGAFPNVVTGASGAVLTHGTGNAQLSVTAGVAAANVNSVSTNAINAAAIADDAIDAGALAANAITDAEMNVTTDVFRADLRQILGTTGTETTAGFAAGNFFTFVDNGGELTVHGIDDLVGTPPTPVEIAAQVRTELAVELGRIDVAISTRLAPTVAARTLDVSTTGEAGLDWANIGSPTTNVALTGTTTAWNAAWDAEVQSEADDAIIAKGLDHLVFASVTGTDVADNSIIAQLVSKSATADWDSYVNTTDSLESSRDEQATIKTKTDFLPSATAGAAGGLFIAGSNAATTVSITGNITGNLSGSVGSVTGAVGSVTGAVGSVTAAVNVGTIETVDATDALDARILAYGALKPTVATRTLDVTATGGAGIDWSNVESQTASVTLSNTQTGLINDAIGPTKVANGSFTKGDEIIGFNDLSAAQVEAEAADAIVLHRLDELLNADSDIDGAAPPVVGSVFHEALTKTAGSFTYDQTTDSNEALRDRGDAAWGGGGGGGATAAEVVEALFTYDTTATYASADAGSFIKQLVPAQTNAVYEEPRAGHNTAGTFGQGQRVWENLDKTGYTLTVTPPTAAEIVTANWAAGTRTLTAGTNIVLAKGIGVTGFNDVSTAQVKTQVETSLSDIFLDQLFADPYSPASPPGNTSALLNKLIQDDSGMPQFTENALEQAPAGGGGGGTDWTADERTAIRSILGVPASGTTPANPSVGILDTIRDAVLAGAPLDAAQIRAALGMSAANLDSQLDALPTGNENASALLGTAHAGFAVNGTVGQLFNWQKATMSSSGVFSVPALANAPVGGGIVFDRADAQMIAGHIVAARGDFYPPRASVWVLRRTEAGIVVRDNVELAKRSGELRRLYVDWAALLGRNEGIETLDATSISGGTATIVVGSPDVTNNLTFFDVQGGAAGQESTVTVAITTTEGQELEAEVTLNVVQ